MRKLLRNKLHAIRAALLRLFNALAAPADAITEVGVRRQARFLAVMAIAIFTVLSLQTGLALASGRRALAFAFLLPWAGAAVAYGLGRTRRPHWGSLLIAYCFALSAFILTGLGLADIATTLYG